MFLTAACSSCSNDAKFGINYALNSDGKVDGMVEVAFPKGTAKLDGNATYNFEWTNVLKLEVNANDVLGLEESLQSKDVKVLEAAEKVNNWLEDAFKIVDYSGHYDIYIKGFVEETFTHLKFEVDKHFSDTPEDPTVDTE
jgi:hypothetical protein